jgi:hypothetical protein
MVLVMVVIQRCVMVMAGGHLGCWVLMAGGGDTRMFLLLGGING